MDYSPSSVLLLVLLLLLGVVGAGYVFLRDGWSSLVQIGTKDVTPKSRQNFIFYDLEPKVKRSKSKVKYFILR